MDNGYLTMKIFILMQNYNCQLHFELPEAFCFGELN